MKKNDYHSRKGQGFLSNFAETNIFPTITSFISQSLFFFFTQYMTVGWLGLIDKTLAPLY